MDFDPILHVIQWTPDYAALRHVPGGEKSASQTLPGSKRPFFYARQMLPVPRLPR